LTTENGSQATPVDQPQFAAVVLDADTGKERTRYQSANPPAVDPAGEQIALWQKGSGIDLTQVGNGVRQSLDMGNVIITSVRYSAGGLLIVENAEHEVTILNKTGQHRLTFPAAEVAHLDAAVSPDGIHLATFGYRVNPTVWDFDTGRPIAILIGHGGDVVDAAFAPDGSEVLTTGSDGKLKLWSLADGALRHTLGGEAEHLLAGRFSPDGRFIVSTSETGVKVWDRSGRALLGFPAENKTRVAPATFGDLDIAASTGNTVVLLRVGPVPGAEELARLIDRLGGAPAQQPATGTLQ
jgi:WD40 repeat protein